VGASKNIDWFFVAVLNTQGWDKKMVVKKSSARSKYASLIAESRCAQCARGCLSAWSAWSSDVLIVQRAALLLGCAAVDFPPISRDDLLCELPEAPCPQLGRPPDTQYPGRILDGLRCPAHVDLCMVPCFHCPTTK
jgi:hypothetical protein